MYFAGRILDARDTPVSGAAVDIWHADGDGHYDVMRPGRRDGETAMRALMRTDEEGRFWFRSVLPTSYPIPDDGPVGAMMRATGRNSIRPAHVHIRVDAPGFQRLTTMLFVDVTRISRAIRFWRQGRLDSPIRADARRNYARWHRQRRSLLLGRL